MNVQEMHNLFVKIFATFSVNYPRVKFILESIKKYILSKFKIHNPQDCSYPYIVEGIGVVH